MQVRTALVICSLTTGLVFSAYSLLIMFSGRSFGSLWRRGRHEIQDKAQKVSTKSKMFKSVSSVKPLRMWIDGKCFTINKFKRNTKKTKQRAIIRTDSKL